MSAKKKSYVIRSLPPGARLNECQVAKADHSAGIVFIRTSDGTVFIANRRWHELDLTADYGSNAKDRSCYAKLAGIPVKDIDEARNAARKNEMTSQKKRDEYALKKSAERLGFKVTRIAPKKSEVKL